jgi:hypothetical protein
MFKKCIAAYVSLLMVLVPFSTALAAQGNKMPALKMPVLDEEKLMEKLNAISPFAMPALQNNQAPDAQAVQRAAQELLVLLDQNDGALSLILDQAGPNMPADDIKQMIRDNLIRLAAFDPVAPGCLTPYTFASLEFWAVSLISFIYFVDYLIYFPEDYDCVLMYLDFWLASLFTALAIYQTYYICAENGKAVPDQSLIVKYESDRTTMRLLALLFYGFTVANVTYCQYLLFGIFGEDRQNN